MFPCGVKDGQKIHHEGTEKGNPPRKVEVGRWPDDIQQGI
jgi:hypothetical protein